MAAIHITNFGGEVPSASARAIPAPGGQSNKNLRLATPEFQPLAGQSSVGAAPAGSVSLYRTGKLAPWWTATEAISYVRGQLNDTPAERTYLTYDSGAQRPRVREGVSTSRVLGVPAPAAAPACTVNVVDELRVSELGDYAESTLQTLTQSLVACVTSPLAGCAIPFAAPGPGSFGWLPHPTDQTQKLLLVPMAGGAIKRRFEFLLDPILGGAIVNVGGTQYWQIAISLFSSTYVVDEPLLRATLTALIDPTEAGVSMFLPSEVDFVALEAAKYLAWSSPPQKDLLDAAISKTGKIQAVLSAAQNGVTDSTFFASADFANQLTQLIGGAGGAKGSVTLQAMSRIYAMVGNSAFGQPGNVDESWITPLTPTRYWQPDFAAYGGFTEAEGLGLIRTDLNACIITDAQGAKRFDADKMRGYLLAEFNLIAGRRPTPESRNFYLAQTSGWVNEILQPLIDFFSTESLERMKLGLSGGASAGAAFAFAIGEAVSALEQVRSLYSVLRDSLPNLASNAFKSFQVQTAERQSARAVVPIIEDRFYIATYVTDWGEESAPSAVSARVEVDQNDTVTVTIAPPPAGRNITLWRLYRTNAGANSAAFQGLHEGPIGTLSFLDVFKGSELQEVCPTITWVEPPLNLRGLVGAPNGVMAGFFGNTVCFCEPYIPYAWPVEYQVTVEPPIVGMAVFGQTIFVGTEGTPYFISGADSASMSAQKVESNQACASARSIAAVQGGVLYASPDGLCLADGNGVTVVSSGLFSREDWQALNPATMHAVEYEGIYYLAHGTGCLTFDLASRKLGRLSLAATTFFVDRTSDELFAVVGSSIVSVFGGTDRRTGEWKTPLITMPAQAGLSWVKVYGQQSPAAPAVVRWWGDGVLRHTATFQNTEPQRLPPGRWLEHEVEIESTARITRVSLAGSTQELQQT